MAPMGLSCTISYHFGAVIIFFIASVPFFNNADPPPMANLSTSWINNPSITSFFNYSLITPVLEASSNVSQMMCGFYCPSTPQQTQPPSCLFGVVTFSRGPQLVWSANGDRPVQINPTLQLTGDGDLILLDSDGTFVWSTNTSSKSVLGMKFTEFGNLVLFDPNNSAVWQSFDHPTDSLLVGQTLFPGQKLTSSTSPSNWAPGLYSFKVEEDNTLAFYIESNPPLAYFRWHSDEKFIKFENATFDIQKIPFTSSSSAQFIRLDPDGHLKAYECGRDCSAVADLMTSYIGDCLYPMVCGNYGICSSNGQCSCLQDATGNSIFRQKNYTQPSLGCSLVTSISCNNSQYYTLLELNNTSYFYFNSYIYYLVENIALEDCKKSCLKNCSCKAALFAYDFNVSKTGCFLLSEVFSLMNNEGQYQNAVEDRGHTRELKQAITHKF